MGSAVDLTAVEGTAVVTRQATGWPVALDDVPAADPTTTAKVQFNRFGRGQPNLNKGGTTARRAILMTSDLTNPDGLPSSTGLDVNNGNVFEDNGAPVTVYRLAAA